nr:hypothetical protein [Bacillus sp. AFS040349]
MLCGVHLRHVGFQAGLDSCFVALVVQLSAYGQSLSIILSICAKIGQLVIIALLLLQTVYLRTSHGTGSYLPFDGTCKGLYVCRSQPQIELKHPCQEWQQALFD